LRGSESRVVDDVGRVDRFRRVEGRGGVFFPGARHDACETLFCYANAMMKSLWRRIYHKKRLAMDVSKVHGERERLNVALKSARAVLGRVHQCVSCERYFIIFL